MSVFTYTPMDHECNPFLEDDCAECKRKEVAERVKVVTPKPYIEWVCGDFVYRAQQNPNRWMDPKDPDKRYTVTVYENTAIRSKTGITLFFDYIPLIKYVRVYAGVDLKQAKEKVDAIKEA
jgi:hypothetical protein